MNTSDVMRKTLELAQSQLNNYKNVPMTDGDLIAELQATIEQLQAENARLREVLVAISDPDSNHPAFIARHAEGKRLDEVYEDMAGEAIDTDSSNWLQEQKAQWRREVLEELGNEAESNGNFVLAHQLKERANSLAEQPESK